MEILDLITRILYIIAIVAVIVGPLAAMLLACRQVTGTWDLRHFYGDSRYWAMSILNFRYMEKKAEGLSAREFVRFFNHNYLSKGFLGMWRLPSTTLLLLSPTRLCRYICRFSSKGGDTFLASSE